MIVNVQSFLMIENSLPNNHIIGNIDLIYTNKGRIPYCKCIATTCERSYKIWFRTLTKNPLLLTIEG